MTGKSGFLQQWSEIFQRNRPYLISLAFRMTGSLSEAEDLAQDTYMESARTNPAEISNHKAWLTKVCSNKCLDHLKQAYKKRESYRGPWLPDAVPDNLQMWSNLTDDIAQEKSLIAAESLTTSFLLLIERLTPEERVVYLLAEVFEYPFKEIAEFLGKTDAACRKVAQRARESVIDGRPKFKNVSGSAGTDAFKNIDKLFQAAKAGDVSAITSLLAEKPEFWSDGGGKVSAAPVVMRDPLQIAKFLMFLGATPAFNSDGFKIESHRVNGLPGLVISRRVGDAAWEFETIVSFEFSPSDGKVERLYVQRNPEKFRGLLSH